MTIPKRLWLLLTALGPAPAKTAEGGPKSLEASDRGMFDGDGDEPDADEPEGDDPKGERDEPDADEPEGDEPDADEPEGDEPEGDEPDGARAKKDDDDDDDDADEPDEDEEPEEDDTALSLRESWEGRLEADARANPEAAPRLASSNWGLREQAKKRFEELREKDADGKFDADAMFEVALDAALQVVGSYHDGVAAPSGDRIEKGLRNVQVGRSLTSFRKEAGERLTSGVEQKMADLYQGFATKFGWRRADKVPLKTLFRMAGGSLKGKAAAKSSGKEPEADDTATRQKRAALGAAAGPRALGRTRAEDGAGKPRKEDRALREFSSDARARAPFFTLE